MSTALTTFRGALLHVRLPVYLACTALALVVNFFIGKEMAWDLLNYHMYAGFGAVHYRLNLDYFPAGPQSYMTRMLTCHSTHSSARDFRHCGLPRCCRCYRASSCG